MRLPSAALVCSLVFTCSPRSASSNFRAKRFHLRRACLWRFISLAGVLGNSLFMNAILQTLLKLQNLEFGSPLAVSTHETEAGALRADIPPALLDHYDRFRARGKKGIALLVNQVCTGCHMSVTTAKLAHVM